MSEPAEALTNQRVSRDREPRPAAGSSRLTVHIERLVLEGLPLRSRDGEAVRVAVETELTGLFNGSELGPELASGGAFASLPPTILGEPAQRRPDGLGAQVARALHQVLGKSGDRK